MINILIVDDDPMVVELNKCYVEQLEMFQCVGTALSIREAISVLEKVKVDLILLDVYMRGETGFELASHIRHNGKNIEIIFITAARDTESVKKAMQYGAIDYLIKPFNFKRFKEALATYKEKTLFMEKKQTISQEEIDTILFTKGSCKTSAELPKGLTSHTLNSVWERILSMKGNLFSTDHLVAQLHISRVSIRKYLNFIEELGVIEGNVEYGLVGRPVKKYRCRQEKIDTMKQYL
jgi:two-component system, CitB family, response regulator MalR